MKGRDPFGQGIGVGFVLGAAAVLALVFILNQSGYGC